MINQLISTIGYKKTLQTDFRVSSSSHIFFSPTWVSMCALKTSANSENGDAQLGVCFSSNLLSLSGHQTRLLFNKEPENTESPYPTSSSNPSLTPREIKDHCIGNATSPLCATIASGARDERFEGGESVGHDSVAMFALGTQHDSDSD